MTTKRISSELTEWSPPTGKGRRAGRDSSSLLLGKIEVGEVRRIYHDDCGCSHSPDGWRCSLVAKISVLRSAGFNLEYYHEDEHIIVVRRESSP